jgi:YidC/Oxa1 family membrane protein insertase
MDNQRNLIVAVVLSVAILFSFQTLMAPPETKKPAGGQTAGGPKTPGVTGPGKSPAIAVKSFKSRSDVLAATKADRVPIETRAVSGSINLVGAVVDDLTLKRYRQEIDKNSPAVNLLLPRGTSNQFFAAAGWIDAKTGQNIAGKDAAGKPVDPLSIKWTLTKGKVLTAETPVTLSATLGGLKFERTYTIDQDYMISVEQKVTNATAKAVSLYPAGWIYRRGEPDTQGFLILHEGPTIMQLEEKGSSGSKKEPDYSDIKEEGGRGLAYNSYGGWLGFRDHYWMVVLIPNQKQKTKAYFAYDPATNIYRALYHQAESIAVAPGESKTAKSLLFAGAKKYDILLAYRDKLGVPRFEWAIDFGRLWFITEPFMNVLIWLFGIFGNFGVAILMLTVMVKAAFFWLSHRAYKSMNKMKMLAPEMKALREKHADDKQRMNQELMGLYRKEKINPAAGCLPILVQIPVFFALYVTLFISLDMRHAPFFGWIEDLSTQDPTSILNLFGLLPFDAPKEGFIGLISIGIWPLIMGLTMWLQQKLNPPPADPMQQKIFMMLPFVFTFMLASFPAGLVVYWAWNNLLSIAQQKAIGVLMEREKARKGTGLAVTNVKEMAAQEANGGKPEPDNDGDGKSGDKPAAGSSSGGKSGGKGKPANRNSNRGGNRSKSRGGNKRRPRSRK